MLQEDNIEWVVENVEAYWDNVDVVFMMGCAGNCTGSKVLRNK